jgi:hypothetical protein
MGLFLPFIYEVAILSALVRETEDFGRRAAPAVGLFK